MQGREEFAAAASAAGATPGESRVGEAQRSLLFPPAPPGGADAGGSSGRSCGSAVSGRGGHGVCCARGVSAGVCVVRAGSVVCAGCVEWMWSLGCARYVAWLLSLPGV